MKDKATIEAMFERLDGERSESLDFARKCARLAGKPWILPDEQWSSENKSRRSRGEDQIPPNFQSVLQRGTSSLKGHFLTNGFPSDSPWFNFTIPGRWLYDKEIPDDEKVETQNDLFMAQLILTSLFESAPIAKDTKDRGLRASMGFRSSIGRFVDNLLVTGDGLIFMRDDFRLRTFRRDWYVTKRDTCGDVLCHVTKEMKEPLELSDKDIETVGFRKSELEEKEAVDRQTKLYTYPEWQPYSRNWVIVQEMNGKVFNEFEEDVSPYISVPFSHTDGDDYGHGFVELNYGDGSTFDRIREACVEYAAMASKFHPCVGIGSNVRPKDLTAPSGTPIMETRMGTNGKPTDVGFLTLDKLNDFTIVKEVHDLIRTDLGKAALLESESAPKGEAGRHSTAWIMSFAELERITGGHYPLITESLQMGLIRRGAHQAMNPRPTPEIPRPVPLIRKFNLQKVEINVLTGLAAMERDRKRQKLIELAQVMQALGPEIQQRLDPAVFIDVYQRYSGFYEPGLVKSEQKIKQEQQRALAMQAQQVAAEEGVKVLAETAKAGLIPQAA